VSATLRIVLVGTGPVARAIAAAHGAAGGRVEAVWSRDGRRAQALIADCGAEGAAYDLRVVHRADAVLVCVADRAVAEAGQWIGAFAGDRVPVLHTSGALAGSALRSSPLGSKLRAGSLHPLQSFPAGLEGPSGARTLAARVPGTHWFHEGEGADVARALVALWGGVFHALAPGGKALYHAGAAVVSNHTVALFADATRLLAAAGVPPDESRAALATLLEGTAANLRAVGVPAALTGPVARGDVATVRRHLEALRAAAPELVESYAAMARRAVVVALEKGAIDDTTAQALVAALA
jgi:predicted short-subunit dehydrogenase-like oxidoreductase (DUF2520 family)